MGQVPLPVSFTSLPLMLGAGGHFNGAVVQIALDPGRGPQRDAPGGEDIAAHGAMQLHHLGLHRALDHRRLRSITSREGAPPGRPDAAGHGAVQMQATAELHIALDAGAAR